MVLVTRSYDPLKKKKEKKNCIKYDLTRHLKYNMDIYFIIRGFIQQIMR